MGVELSKLSRYDMLEGMNYFEETCARMEECSGGDYVRYDDVVDLIEALQHSGEPIAAVKGWFHGECIIQPLDPAAVLPAGMALYATPQPVVPDGFCLDIGHRRHKERTGDVCTCAKYIRHPACDKHEVRPLLPETNPLLSAGKETTNE
jgi:hypothetical protein